MGLPVSAAEGSTCEVEGAHSVAVTGAWLLVVSIAFAAMMCCYTSMIVPTSTYKKMNKKVQVNESIQHGNAKTIVVVVHAHIATLV